MIEWIYFAQVICKNHHPGWDITFMLDDNIANSGVKDLPKQGMEPQSPKRLENYGIHADT